MYFARKFRPFSVAPRLGYLTTGTHGINERKFLLQSYLFRHPASFRSFSGSNTIFCKNNFKFTDVLLETTSKASTDTSVQVSRIVSDCKFLPTVEAANSDSVITSDSHVIDGPPNDLSDISISTSQDSFGVVASYIKFFDDASKSDAVLKIMKVLRDCHDGSGLPWWTTIILTTFILRTSVTLPLAIYQNYVMAKFELVQIELKTIAKELIDFTKFEQKRKGWDGKKSKMFYQKELKEARRELLIRDNCHPAKSAILIMGQLPLWLMLSLSFRNLTLAQPFQTQGAIVAYEQLSEEGVGWISNLTLSDPYFLLPFGVGAMNLLITELLYLSKGENVPEFMKKLVWLYRGLAVITIPVSIYMPSGVVLYWATSSFCAFVQAMCLLSPNLRSFFKIPITVSTQKHPYKTIVTSFKRRFST